MTSQLINSNVAYFQRTDAMKRMKTPEAIQQLIAHFKLSGRLLVEADEHTYPLFSQGDVVKIQERQFRCQHVPTDLRFGLALENQVDTVFVLPSVEVGFPIVARMTLVSVGSTPLWQVQAKRIQGKAASILDLAGVFGLTKGESRVLDLVVEGLAYEIIAAKLFVSQETIKSHMKSIYSKTKVSGRADLLSLVLRFLL